MQQIKINLICWCLQAYGYPLFHTRTLRSLSGDNLLVSVLFIDKDATDKSNMAFIWTLCVLINEIFISLDVTCKKRCISNSHISILVIKISHLLAMKYIYFKIYTLLYTPSSNEAPTGGGGGVGVSVCALISQNT